MANPTEPGWYETHGDPLCKRYWDGHHWVARMRYMDGTWVHEDMPGEASVVPGQAAPAEAPDSGRRSPAVAGSGASWGGSSWVAGATWAGGAPGRAPARGAGEPPADRPSAGAGRTPAREGARAGGNGTDDLAVTGRPTPRRPSMLQRAVHAVTRGSGARGD